MNVACRKNIGFKIMWVGGAGNNSTTIRGRMNMEWYYIYITMVCDFI